MNAATVHYLPSAAGPVEVGGLDHAATIDALVVEVGTLAGQLADALDQLDRTRAALDQRSTERDQWHTLALAYFGEGYRAGFVAGEEVGAERAIRAWKLTARSVDLDGPSAVELDRRRYPPDGRASWFRPRVADVWSDWSAWCSTEEGEA